MKCYGSENLNTASELFDKEEFSLENGAYISIYRSKRCQISDFIPLNDSVRSVEYLISGILEILSNKLKNMKNKKLSKLLATIRKSNIMELSMFMGEDNAPEYAIKIILCMSNLIFQASGSWCEYIYKSDNKFIEIGDCRFRKEIWSRNDRNFVNSALISQDIQGIFCIEEPVAIKQAESMSRLFVKEILLIFELDDMLKTMKSEFEFISTLDETAVVLVGRSKIICYANRVAWDMLDLSDGDFLKIVEPNVSTPWCDCIADGIAKPARGIKEYHFGRSIDWVVLPLIRKTEPYGWVVMLNDESKRQGLKKITSVTELMAANQMIMRSFTHEIKNPLASIRGILQMIISNKESGELCKYLELGIREIDRANRLVDDLYQIESIATKSSGLVDLNNYLESIIPALKGMVSSKSVRIDVELCEAVTIYTDLEQFNQVVINIVRNAVEAIEDDGFIHISSRKANPQWVEILFRDSGAGISPQMKKRLFDPFITTKDEGTGLGLNICKAIIHNNGGEVSARNHPEGGALFCIIIPSGEHNSSDADKQDVLLITCGDLTQKLVEQSLLPEGFKVTTVSTLDNALFMLIRYNFALVVFEEPILNLSDYYTFKEAYPEIDAIILSNDKPAVEYKDAQYISKTLLASVFVETVRQKISNSKKYK